MWALWCDYFGAWKILLAGLFGWSGLSGCSGWFGFLWWFCYDFIVDLHWFRYMLRMGGPEMEDTQRGPSKLKMWYHCVQENYPPRKVAKFLRKKRKVQWCRKNTQSLVGRCVSRIYFGWRNGNLKLPPIWETPRDAYGSEKVVSMDSAVWCYKWVHWIFLTGGG